MLTVGPAGAQPQPRQLLRRDRAGGLPSGPRGAGHRLQQRPAAAGAAVLVHRHAAVAPGRPQLPRAADQPRRCARSTTSSATACTACWSRKGQVVVRAELAGQRRGVPRRRRRSRASRASPKRSSRPRSAAAARASTTTSARRRCSGTARARRRRSTSSRRSSSSCRKVETPADPPARRGQPGACGRQAGAQGRRAAGHRRRRTPRPPPAAPGFASSAPSCRSETSPALSMEAQRPRHRHPQGGGAGGQRASSSARCKVIQQALQDAGATSRIVAAHLGFVATSSGQQLASTTRSRTCPR